MTIDDIIFELKLKKIIDIDKYKCDLLSGGTNSKVYVLTYNDRPVYCIKMNEPLVVRLETFFLKFYDNITILPKLFYTEPSNKYFIYSFIVGELKDMPDNKAKLLQQLTQQLINHYKPVSNFKGWGWTDKLSDSWQQFLIENTNYAKKILASTLTLEDYSLVISLIEKQNKKNDKRIPYLLHGDCGIHNFIFQEQNLCGVIDPIPVVGEPIYDLIYAFCSSPDNLTIGTLQKAISSLKINNYENELIYEYVLIGLYARIATCIKHHPNDLSRYLAAWNYWLYIVSK